MSLAPSSNHFCFPPSALTGNDRPPGGPGQFPVRAGTVLPAEGQLRLGAAGVERAARGDVDRAGRLPLEGRRVEGPLRGRPGHRGQQRLGVGVQPTGGQDRTFGHFHEPAHVHHGHPVADLGDDPQVVGDEEVGEAVALLQLRQEVQNLGLDGDVQGADGLVRHDEPGFQGQGPGDAQALALAAAEFVGIAVGDVTGEPHFLEEFLHPGPALHASAQVMDDVGLLQDLAHGHAGVERGIGILEDDLDLAAQLLQALAGDPGQVFPGEDDAAPGGR